MEIVSYASHLWKGHLNQLKNRLHAARFRRRVIVVGGPLIKERIMRFLVEEEGVAFGIKVLDLSSAMNFFHHVCENSLEKPTPSPSLLATYLEIQMENLPEIADYLQGKQKRKQLLADRLAKLFIRYGRYGEKSLQEWECSRGWQQTLWKKAKKIWGFPNEVKPKKPAFPIEVHLFGIPHIPQIFQNELKFLAQHWEVYAYHFSPSGEYWEDLCTVKEQACSEFGEIGHPLLSNFGSLGKQMFDFYQTALTAESYPINAPKTVLESLRNDIVLLEITPFSADESMQLHIAPTKKEEVEGLYKSLLTLMVKDPTITPEAILVFAPDISLYHSYIQWVFGRSDSILGFTIDGVNSCEQTEYSHCLLYLFSLVEARWSVQEVLKLFHYAPFLKRFNLSKEDVGQIREWILHAGIHWGKDGTHRQQFLEQDSQSVGTWEEGFYRLLLSLSNYSTDLRIEFSQATLLGKLLFIFENLFADLQVMKWESFTIAGWVNFIRALTKAYLVDESPFVEEALRELSVIPGENKVGFTTVRRFLEKVLSTQRGMVTNGKNPIRFSSLKAGNVCEAKVIWVMGMDEGAFPRGKQQDHLDILTKQQNTPNPNVEDRFAGLEVLLSAESYCIFSYVNRCQKDGKEVGPSLFVTEVEKAVVQKGAALQKITNPSFSFHEKYFSKSGYPVSFSQKEQRTAEAYYGMGQHDKTYLFPEFYTHEKPKTTKHFSQKTISIDGLVKLMRNPLQLYLNETLQIYTRDFDHFFPTMEEEFIYSALDRFKHREKVLFSGNLEKPPFTGLFYDLAVIQGARELEQYQKGLQKLNIDPKTIFTLVLSSHIKESRIENRCLFVPPVEVGLPNGESVYIEGKIDHLCSEGLLVFQKKSIKSELAAIPKLLICSAFAERIDTNMLFVEKGVKKAFPREKAKECLEQLIAYYIDTLENGSPFHPLLFDELFNEDLDKAQQKIDTIFRSSHSFLDRYLEWVTMIDPPFNVDHIQKKWRMTKEQQLQQLADWVKTGEVL